MKNKLNELVGCWFGRLNDICEELNEIGLDVCEVNSEYIIAEYVDGDDYVQIMVKLGGTPSTITFNSWEEVFRG